VIVALTSSVVIVLFRDLKKVHSLFVVVAVAVVVVVFRPEKNVKKCDRKIKRF
jgi:hypothetical protein